MIVAIDGHAGAGKSTTAQALARWLGFAYLDSGAMYRCVALLALASPDAEPAKLARAARIELGGTGSCSRGEACGEEAGSGAAGAGRVLLDGHDVTGEIRAPAVSEMASCVAADPGVRAALVAAQRELIAVGDWVVEGRDIGTVVAPEAELKIFLTAGPEERARRRAAELGVDRDGVAEELRSRDERDSAREHSPLEPAADAELLDTTGLTVEQVVERLAALLHDGVTGR